jgi:cyclophilin family peptidyl-prolyl cis-trans isomerase
MNNIHIFVIIIIVILVSWWLYACSITSEKLQKCSKCNIDDDYKVLQKPWSVKEKKRKHKVMKPILKKDKIANGKKKVRSKSKNKEKKSILINGKTHNDERKFDNSSKLESDEHMAYLNITINKRAVGTIIIKLFTDVTPITCKNFMHLCDNNREYSYNKTKFHRIIKDFMIQGGDIEGLNGKGGMSIYGRSFDDENFILKHDRPYLLSMANHGPDTNGSQFFITTNCAEHLDGKHVVFGEVVSGHAIVDKLNNIETNGNDMPSVNCCIDTCYAQ